MNYTQVGTTRVRSLDSAARPSLRCEALLSLTGSEALHATRLIHKSQMLKIYNYAWLNLRKSPFLFVQTVDHSFLFEAKTG